MKKLTVNDWAKAFGGIGSAKEPVAFVHKATSVGATQSPVMFLNGCQCGGYAVLSGLQYVDYLVADLESKKTSYDYAKRQLMEVPERLGIQYEELTADIPDDEVKP